MNMIPNDPFLKQLLETFGPELESLLPVITDNLQALEQDKTVSEGALQQEEISRSGRNIKVLALSVGHPHVWTQPWIPEIIE